MITDTQMWEAGWSFNYSDASWEAIGKQVSRIANPAVPFNYMNLLEAANIYLEDSHQPPREQSAIWADIEEAIKQLRVKACSWLTRPSDLDVFSKEFVTQLNMYEDEARCRKNFAQNAWDPKTVFYRTVLDCWCEAGGLLGVSRSSSSDARPSGPTVIYFEAVVTPVMEERAPGRERIRQLIRAHKKWEKELQSLMEEADAKERKATEIFRFPTRKARRFSNGNLI